jgi:hypothetical protein
LFNSHPPLKHLALNPPLEVSKNPALPRLSPQRGQLKFCQPLPLFFDDGKTALNASRTLLLMYKEITHAAA